jgi:CheY-like chemotaxis protein
MVRCLIVDDSMRFLEVARVLLERDGIAVVGVASNGSQALGAAAKLRPDVTLVDVDLGGESGFALAGRLAQQSGGALPVILTSAHAGEDYAELVAASPAVGFLPKTSLSGRAIRDMLDGANGPRET